MNEAAPIAEPGLRVEAPAVRLFVGIPVATAVLAALSAACESLARRAAAQHVSLRWTAPATYHVTLKYLGWARPEVLPAVQEAIARASAGIDPFRFRTARLGAFPHPAQASVVWAGVDDLSDVGGTGSGALDRLARALDRELAAIGFPAEQRSFRPHVTLARVREPTDVAGVLLPFAEQTFGETRAGFLNLFRTDVKSESYGHLSMFCQRLAPSTPPPERQSSVLEPTPFDASPDTEDGWERHPG